MKQCLICGYVSADAIVTCPWDGEASWLTEAARGKEHSARKAEERLGVRTRPAPEPDTEPTSPVAARRERRR